MSLTIADLQDNLQGMIHGSSVSKISNIFSLFGRAASSVLLDVDLAETRRVQQIPNALYDSILDYSAPTDLKGNRIIDIRPSGERSGSDNLNQSFGKEFDLMKNNSSYTVRQNKGIKTVRISKSLTAPTLLHDCSSLTSNGTWTASGVAIALAADTVNFVTGSGSLRFNSSGAGTASITNSTLNAIDISSLTDGSLFLWFYTPTGSSVTAVSLLWGSSATDYYSVSATTNHFGQAFANGWNLVRFDQTSAATTGAPDATVVNYLKVNLAVSGALSSLRVDNIVDIKGVAWEMEYYSKYLFADGTTGAWKEFPTDISDTINLDTESMDVYLRKCAVETYGQLQGASLDRQQAEVDYAKALSRYKSLYKSETVEPRQFYYRMK